MWQVFTFWWILINLATKVFYLFVAGFSYFVTKTTETVTKMISIAALAINHCPLNIIFSKFPRLLHQIQYFCKYQPLSKLDIKSLPWKFLWPQNLFDRAVTCPCERVHNSKLRSASYQRGQKDTAGSNWTHVQYLRKLLTIKSEEGNPCRNDIVGPENRHFQVFGSRSGSCLGVHTQIFSQFCLGKWPFLKEYLRKLLKMKSEEETPCLNGLTIFLDPKTTICKFLGPDPGGVWKSTHRF